MTSTRRFDGVVFDVGGVLVESPFVAGLRWRERMRLPDAVVGALFSNYASVPEPGEEPHAWHRVETGHLTLAGFFDLMRGELAVAAPDFDAGGLHPADFNPFAEAGALWPMVHLTRRLRAAGLATAICTNNVREWAEWRATLPVDEFDVVVDSCEVGLRKPDPAVYRLVADRLGIATDRLVFCDDLADNVAAAEDVGMTGVFVTDDVVAALAAVEELMGGPGVEAATAAD